MRFALAVRAIRLVLLLGGCSVVIDSSRYVADVDGGAAPDATPDGRLPDGSVPFELGAAGSVALGDYAPLAGDTLPVLLGPNTLGVTPTLEWRLDADPWQPLAATTVTVPDAAVGRSLFVRATWTPSAGEPLERVTGPAVVLPRLPRWRQVLPDLGRDSVALWDPVHQRWLFVSEQGEPSWWELAIPVEGLPRLVPLPTPDAVPRMNEGDGFVAVPDLARQRLLLVGTRDTGVARVFAVSLQRSGPLEITAVPAGGAAPRWRRMVGSTWVPDADPARGAVLVCGGFFDGGAVETDECSFLRIDAEGATWETAPTLPSPSRGISLFAHAGRVYGFGGWSAASGARDTLLRLDDSRWVPVDVGLTATRAQAGVATLGSRVHLVGGVTLVGAAPQRAGGVVVVDFATDPPTLESRGEGLPGGVASAAGFVGRTLYVFDGFEPNDEGAGFEPGSFRRVIEDGRVEGVFVFDETTPPPLVSAVAGWARDTSLLYGGQRVVGGEAESRAWTFEDGVQRPVRLEGVGPGPLAEVVVDTRAIAGTSEEGLGLPWTFFGGADEDARALWVYDDRWESQPVESGGPPVALRGSMVVHTQGCGGARTFLVGGATATEVVDTFEEWRCDEVACGWAPSLPSPGPVVEGTLSWDGDRALVLLGGRSNEGLAGHASYVEPCGDAVWRDIGLSSSDRARLRRRGHTTTVLGTGDESVFVVVGGLGEDGAPLEEVVALRLSGLGTPTVDGDVASLPGGPSARAFHVAVRNRAGDRLWVAGGEGAEGQLRGDVWELRYP
ncbi:MAG: hypothetical protein H6721_31230 [Sandaracinus sp.]|nr:hypothetical protein [Sandaracinus sp.]MCB9636605.1 hypothetical protein [Sandaracinus sp.]